MSQSAEGNGLPSELDRLQRAKEFLDDGDSDALDDLLQDLLERVYPTMEIQDS